MLLSKSRLLLYHPRSDLVLYCRTLNHAGTILKADYSSLSQDTATFKRGTGGRSSFSGIVATVFGASGFLGKYVVNELGKIGSQIVIPYRGTSYSVRELRLAGDLGQVVYVPYNARSDDDIRKSIKYSNLVINLIGKDTETRNFSHESVHVDIAARIARISTEMGVEKLIHLSALNAAPNVRSFLKPGGSSFLRTKALGELEVRREFPDAIIFRPSDIYGHGDRFMYYYYRGERRVTLPNRFYMPLYENGRSTFKQPVFAGDLVKGIMFAVTDPDCRGLTVEAVGPHRYRLDHLVWWILMVLRFPSHLTKIVGMNPLFKQKVRFFEMLKAKYPQVSVDRLERECHSDSVLGLANLQDMGVETLTNLEDRILYELRHLRRLSYYWDAIGEIQEVPPPPRSVL